MNDDLVTKSSISSPPMRLLRCQNLKNVYLVNMKLPHTANPSLSQTNL